MVKKRKGALRRQNETLPRAAIRVAAVRAPSMARVLGRQPNYLLRCAKTTWAPQGASRRSPATIASVSTHRNIFAVIDCSSGRVPTLGKFGCRAPVSHSAGNFHTTILLCLIVMRLLMAASFTAFRHMRDTKACTTECTNKPTPWKPTESDNFLSINANHHRRYHRSRRGARVSNRSPYPAGNLDPRPSNC